ncbi:hypothetical protein Cgig2_027321 [Carnegiea gigantea]|uniref:Ubiquitin-like protease family profile domain-containing protein n=1 Tax=Carnegiea gigantea TaxID=171969 RepID=A0A9Q1JIW6_9CARY|nr:hypothetical protein Cgig2_027321 [Carnegiea gigantea]
MYCNLLKEQQQLYRTVCRASIYLKPHDQARLNQLDTMSTDMWESVENGLKYNVRNKDAVVAALSRTPEYSDACSSHDCGVFVMVFMNVLSMRTEDLCLTSALGPQFGCKLKVRLADDVEGDVHGQLWSLYQLFGGFCVVFGFANRNDIIFYGWKSLVQVGSHQVEDCYNLNSQHQESTSTVHGMASNYEDSVPIDIDSNGEDVAEVDSKEAHRSTTIQIRAYKP